MNKWIWNLTLVAIAASCLPAAKASDRGWFVAGPVLAGVVVVSSPRLLTVEKRCAPVYYPAPVPCGEPRYLAPRWAAPTVVYPPTVYCAPAPSVVYRAPFCVAPAPRACPPTPLLAWGWAREPRHCHHFR